MKFKDKTYDDVGVISLKGKLMGRPETDELHDEIRAMLGSKILKIILDLEDSVAPSEKDAAAILVRNAEPDKVLAELHKFKGTILHSSLPPDFEKILAEAGPDAGF